MTQALRPLGTPSATRPKTQIGAFFPNVIRNSFTTSTWLAFGAALQALLFTLPIRRSYAVAPVVVYLALTALDTTLKTLHVIPNDFLHDAIPFKHSAVIPPRKGGFAGARDVASEKICVLLLGVTFNHPLGVLAPGAKTLSGHFQEMVQDLEARADETGYLGHSSWAEQSDRRTKPSMINVFYFRSLEDVHRFAEGPVHRRGWAWFNTIKKQYPHLGIYHEVFEAPAGSWEVVYAGQKPVLFGKTQHKIVDDDGREQWVSPLVEAKGRMSTTYTRLGMKEAEEV